MRYENYYSREIVLECFFLTSIGELRKFTSSAFLEKDSVD